MTDIATPNLPSRDFDVTEAFFGPLGFERSWRDDGWLILRRGDLQLEFFLFPDVDPASVVASMKPSSSSADRSRSSSARRRRWGLATRS